MGILRFLLAITVVVAHTNSLFGFSFVGANLAVQAFYIISGFYMTLILKEKYIGVNHSYSLFLTNRFLRLYPVYWTVLLLTLVFSTAVFIFSNGKYYNAIFLYVQYYHTLNISSFLFLLFTNIFLFFQDSVMFFGLDISNGYLFFTTNFREANPKLHEFIFIPQAWTIGIELSFYVIAPFLVKRKIQWILLFISLSILLRYLLIHNGLKADPWSYRFFPTELVFFLMGIVSYHVYNKYKNIEIHQKYLQASFALILGFTLFFNFLPIPGKQYIYLLLLFIFLPAIFKFSEKSKKDRYIGELSYPIYISHLFILSVLQSLHCSFIYGLGLIVIIITVLFSIVLYEGIVKRVEKVRQSRVLIATVVEKK